MKWPSRLAPVTQTQVSGLVASSTSRILMSAPTRDCVWLRRMAIKGISTKMAVLIRRGVTTPVRTFAKVCRFNQRVAERT